MGSSSHGCWLGSYEWKTRLLFEQFVGCGDVVYDVGAHVGFYTLLASVLVGPTGRVVAIEPFPRNLAYLRRHLTLNQVCNVVVKEGAVYDTEGEMQLTGGPDSLINHSTVHLDAEGMLPVRTLTLDQLVFRDGLPPPTVIKMDIEGAEYVALRGAIRLLSEKRPLLFLATHSPQIHAECCRLLVALGYSIKSCDGKSVEVSSELLAEAKTY